MTWPINSFARGGFEELNHFFGRRGELLYAFFWVLSIIAPQRVFVFVKMKESIYEQERIKRIAFLTALFNSLFIEHFIYGRRFKRSATILASGRCRNPYFVVLWSLLFGSRF